MRHAAFILSLLVCFCPVGLWGQSAADEVYVTPPSEAPSGDSVVVARLIDEGGTLAVEDSVAQETAASDTAAFQPDPEKAVWLGAIIPGYGQIINKKYWQLPIVYGAYMGCAFAVTWFSSEYQFYKTAYRDIIDSDPTTNSHLEYLESRGVTLAQMGGETSYRDRLKTFQDNYRRYRDYSIIASVLVYGLSILWAYVDAQLYDYDISPDLSLNIQPAIINGDMMYANKADYQNAFGQSQAFEQSNAVGIQCRFRLK